MAQRISDENFKVVYTEMCKTFHKLDEMRVRRFQLLPVISGVSAATILAKAQALQKFLTPLGVFGFIVTAGMFCYEIRTTHQCSSILNSGIDLEREFGVCGQFMSFPTDKFSRVGPTLAASLIYSAVASVWAACAIYQSAMSSRWLIVGGIFILGLWPVYLAQHVRDFRQLWVHIAATLHLLRRARHTRCPRCGKDVVFPQSRRVLIFLCPVCDSEVAL